MEIQEADQQEQDEDAAACRARARDLLTEITQQVKQRLDEADIELDVFLVIPTTGDAIATFGTMADPPAEVWERVSEIVCSAVRKAVGLDRVRCRELTCAMTTDRRGGDPADWASTPQPIPLATATSAGDETHDIEPADVRLPRGYPVLAEIRIDAATWFEFERLFGDTPVAKIIGRYPCEGRLLVRLACISESVRDRLRDGWE